jgi:hypothetical protein
MKDSEAGRQSSNAMGSSTPNLTVMVHHYTRAEHLFRTVTMYPEIEREQVLDEVVTAKTWYWGRFASENRQGYMKTRLFVESRMYEEFSRKYWPPKHRSPVFFYMYPELSLSAIEERLRQRKLLDEPHTEYLLVDLRDLPDITHVSFTLCDSHTSYREALIRKGLSTKKPGPTLTDHGTVFHIREIAEVYDRHKDEKDLYFEIQVWDPEILVRWRDAHDATSSQC